MGDAFIVRRGGDGLSKCSIIVHIDTGSTVAAYSNAAATTKVKDGKEIGTSGDYLITGLEIGTYYVKATKGSKTKISSAVTFSSYGVKDVPLVYALVLFSADDQHTSVTGGWGGAVASANASYSIGNNIVLNYTDANSAYTAVGTNNKIDLSEYSTLNFTINLTEFFGNYNGEAKFGVIDSKYDTLATNIPASIFISASTPSVGSKTVSISLNDVTSAYCVIQGIMKCTITDIWAE